MFANGAIPAYTRPMKFPRCSLPAFVALCAALLAPPRASAEVKISKVPYHGWAKALTMSNGKVEVVIVPEIGRVMQFRWAGESDGPFWENRALDGKPTDPKSKDWGNFGGDKTWPAPQADWGKIAGRGWPPPAAFDSMPVQAEIVGSKVILKNPTDTSFGIAAERTIELDASEALMRIRTVYHKRDGGNIKAGVWIITQLKDPEKMFVPLPKKSIFPEMYNKQSEDLPANLRIEDGFLTATRSPKQSSKIGTDASSLIWGDAKWIVRVTMARDADANYPDQGSSAEIYTNSDPLAYVELELLGPLHDMKVGETIAREQTYELFRRDGSSLEGQVRRLPKGP